MPELLGLTFHPGSIRSDTVKHSVKTWHFEMSAQQSSQPDALSLRPSCRFEGLSNSIACQGMRGFGSTQNAISTLVVLALAEDF